MNFSCLYRLRRLQRLVRQSLPIAVVFSLGWSMLSDSVLADDQSPVTTLPPKPVLSHRLIQTIPAKEQVLPANEIAPQATLLSLAQPLSLTQSRDIPETQKPQTPARSINGVVSSTTAFALPVTVQNVQRNSDAGKLSVTLPETSPKFSLYMLADTEPLNDAIVPALPLIVSETEKRLSIGDISEGLIASEYIDAPSPKPSTADVADNAAHVLNTQSSATLVTGDLRGAWLMFQDPVLQEMIESVISQNPGLREAQARIAQSRASFNRATADLFPQVTANAQHGYRRFSQNGNAFVQDSTTTQGFDWYSSGFDTRWEVDLFGRLRGIRNAAGFEAQAAEQSYRDVMVTLIGDLMLSYVEYAMATERIRIAMENLRVQQEILELTEERFRLGEDGQLAVVQARTQVELTQTTIPTFQEQRSVALHRLLLLQGFGSQAIEIPEYWGQRLPELPSRLPNSIDCELLARRPDVRSSRLLVAAQLERLGASKAEYYPQVFLNGNISLETRDLDVWWDERSVAHSVGPMISLNLLDFGRIRATVQGERAKVEQAVARYRQSVLDATEEVRNAMVGVERQRERTEALSVAARSARSVVDMAKVEYREGVTNFQNVLDAERQVLSIEDQHAVAYGTALVSYARLFKALGGAWYDSIELTEFPIGPDPFQAP